MRHSLFSRLVMVLGLMVLFGASLAQFAGGDPLPPPPPPPPMGPGCLPTGGC